VSGAFELAIAAAVDAALARWQAAAAGAAAVRAIAVGWTTVELARAEASIRETAADAVGPFADAPGDEVLGAHARAAGLRLAAVPTVRTLVLLEPSTESRLAASLARLGEGPAVVWLAWDAGAGVPAGDAITSAPGAGPFGRERLLLGGERDGRPVLVLDDAPGTIAT
jgi:hypothetical protein